MMREVGVHDDHKVARAELQPMDVRRPAHRTRVSSPVLGQSPPESSALTYPSPNLPARGFRICSALVSCEQCVQRGATHDLVRSVDCLELLCDLQSAIWRRVVYDDDFPLQLTAVAAV